MKKYLLVASLGLLSCKEPAQNTPPTTTPPSSVQAVSPEKATTAPVASAPTSKEDPAPTSEPSLLATDKPAAAAASNDRYSEPTERRLYVNRVEASHTVAQYYHPFHLMDDDPESAWAYPKKKSAWVRLNLSAVDGATKVRLRIKVAEAYPGYFPKKLDLTALPGGQKMSATLKATEDWQEVVFELKAVKETAKATVKETGDVKAILDPKESTISGLELAFSGMHDKKPKDVEEEYEDEFDENLRLSELEVYVTGLTRENASFEKEKLDQIKTWKKIHSRSEEEETPKGKPLPVADYYEIETFDDDTEGLSKQDPESEDYYNPFGVELKYEPAFKILAGHLPPESKDVLARAQEAIKSKPAKWVPLQVTMTALKPYFLPPDVEGIEEPYVRDEKISIGEFTWSGAFLLPRFGFGTLLVKDQLAIVDGAPKERPKGCEKTSQNYFWRRPETPADNPKEIIMDACLVYEDRGGAVLYRVTQIFEYDDKGRVQLWVTPYFIQWFDWNEKGVLTSATRVSANAAEKLTQAPRPPKPPTPNP